MTIPQVREVGRVQAMDGLAVAVGVDYDAISLTVAGHRVLLESHQAETFAQLYVAAVWQAGQQRRRMTEEEP